tara:strand:+ start:538 stop:747 length:210 start_codon:yes stop_codon:yes gene_type:complete
MEKYKNKDGIELSYTGNDSHQVLVREVVSEAVKILSAYRMDSPQSMGWAIQRGVDFLKTNFNIKDKNGE